MTTADATATASARAGWLELNRDDGPLSLALGRLLGLLFALPAPTLLLASIVPLVVALAAGGAHLPEWALAPGIASVVLFGGISSARPPGGFDWLVPPLLRVLEYGLLLWTAVLAGGWATRSCFALLGVLAFRHYDAVYRLRYRGAWPPRWVRLAGGGWEIRLLLAYAALLVHASAVGMLVAAALLALLSVGESAAGWLTLSRARGPALYADEEEDEE